MDPKKLMDDKAIELEPMFKRMRADEKQIYGKGYKLLGPSGKEATKAYHVNLLYCLHFITKAIQKLTGVSRQVLIESEDMSGEKIEIIEQFFTDLQFAIDNRLSAIGDNDAFAQHAEIVCARGPIAEQVLLRMENDRFVPDCRPLDTLNFLYEMDADNMHWGAVVSRRSAFDIITDYPKAKVAGKTGIVKDFYDDKLHVVYVNNGKELEDENQYKEPPFAIAFPSTTSALRGEDYLKRKSDSLLHLTRSEAGDYLFDEMNYLASILKTQAGETLKPPLQKLPKPDGTVASVEESYPGPGEVISADSRIFDVPKPDVRMSTQMYLQQIDALLQRATYSALDYGMIDLPLAFVTVNRMMENKGDLLLPRLNCIASLFQATARMKLRQFESLATTVEIGEEGHERAYKPSDLGGKYTIKYRFHTMSQEQLAAGSSICAALGDLVDDEFKLDVLLKLDNPTEMLDRRDAQAARMNNPSILIFEQVMALIDKQEKSSDKEMKMELDMKARLHLAHLISLLRQKKASENVPLGKPIEEGQPEEKPKELMPVFAQGGNKAKKQSQLKEK